MNLKVCMSTISTHVYVDIDGKRQVMTMSGPLGGPAPGYGGGVIEPLPGHPSEINVFDLIDTDALKAELKRRES